MPTARDLPIAITARNEVAAAAQASRSEIRALAAEIKQVDVSARQSASGLRDVLGTLKENFGRGSALAMGLKALSFSGPLIGAKLAVETLTEAYKGFVGWVDRLNQGGKEAWNEQVKGIEEARKALDSLAETAKRTGEQVGHVHFEATSAGLNEFSTRRERAAQELRDNQAKADELDKTREELRAKFNTAKSPAVRQQAGEQLSNIDAQQDQIRKESRIAYNAEFKKIDEDEKKSRLDKIAEVAKKREEDHAKELSERKKLYDDMLDDRASFEAANLEKVGKAAEAELVMARRAGQKKREEGAALIAQGVTQGDISKVVAGEARMAAAAQPEAKAGQRIADENRQRSAEAARTEHNAKMDMLRAAAAGGDQNLQREEKKQAILEKKAEKLREIDELEHKATTSASQRAALEQAKKYVEGASQIEMLEAMKPHERLRLSSAIESRGTGGSLDLLREKIGNRPDPTAEKVKDIYDKLNNPSVFFGGLWDSFVSKAPTIAAATSSIGGAVGNFFRSPNT